MQCIQRLWITAIVKPIYQGEDPDLCLISLLSIFTKIYETTLNNHIESHLNKFNMICENQYGFINKSKTHLQHVSTYATIYSKVWKLENMWRWFRLKLLRPFDSVNHEMLIQELFEMNIKGKEFELMKSSLYGSTQTVAINEYLCSSRMLSNGIPQGLDRYVQKKN